MALSFGEMLRRYRREAGKSLEDLHDACLGLSVPYLSLIEQGKRAAQSASGKPILRREQIWHLIRKLDLWPPDVDTFLAAAGHALERSEHEELALQSSERLKELWVYTWRPLEETSSWLALVTANLKRGVHYSYFVENPAAFEKLLTPLQDGLTQDAQPPPDHAAAVLKAQLECFVLPAPFFTCSFAIYNPRHPDVHCTHTKLPHGQAPSFYTVPRDQTIALYKLLAQWRDHLHTGRDLRLPRPYSLYPEARTIRFVCES